MLVLTATQKCLLSIAIVDAKGNPAAIDGTPEWSSSDPSRVAISPSLDGLSATIVAVGPVTTSDVQINVVADADLDGDVKPLVGILDVSVIAGEATMIAITPGAPQEQ